MFRWLGVAVAAARAGCGAASASQEETSSIRAAVRAPVRAYKDRHAAALCASFTPEIAGRLVPGSSSCVAGVEHSFHVIAHEIEFWASSELPKNLKIKVRRQGQTASVVTTWPWNHLARFSLRKVGGRWLIASPTTFVEEVFCYRLFGERDCKLRAYSMLFGNQPARVVHNEPARPLKRRREGNFTWYSER
jgi:hypothetical protein